MATRKVKTRTIRNVVQNARGKAGGIRTTKIKDKKTGDKRKVVQTYSDAKKRKIKTVLKEKGKKKVKTKVKYNKDGSVKKIVTKKGGKRKVYKGKNPIKKYNKANYPNMTKEAHRLLSRDNPLPKSDW
jgi:hypothetical protein